MTLRAQLDNDLKDAMRAKDSLRLETIRSIKAAILSKEVGGDTIDDNALFGIIRGLIKQREDSIEQYKEGGRADLVEKETLEKDILAKYLPAAPDSASVEKTVREVIAELSATTMKDMGKVMQAASARLGPAVDSKALSQLVKQALAPRASGKMT
jgi:hypothetical protein